MNEGKVQIQSTFKRQQKGERRPEDGKNKSGSFVMLEKNKMYFRHLEVFEVNVSCCHRDAFCRIIRAEKDMSKMQTT